MLKGAHKDTVVNGVPANWAVVRLVPTHLVVAAQGVAAGFGFDDPELPPKIATSRFSNS